MIINSLLSSFLFLPCLYLLGWILSTILGIIFPSIDSDRSLYGTIITFVLFFFLLPYWSKSRWDKNFFNFIGIKNFRDKNILSRLFKETLKGIIIISIVSLLIYFGGFAKLNININIQLILDTIFLSLFVGIAEELVFRLWLFEELNLYLTPRKSNIVQAFIFSLAHFRWNMGVLSNMQFLIGLFLLGLYLNNWRRREIPSILFPISFHATLVGVWFFINNAFLNINSDIPVIIFGPGKGGDINPIGGLIGISILLFLNFYNRQQFYKY